MMDEHSTSKTIENVIVVIWVGKVLQLNRCCTECLMKNSNEINGLIQYYCGGITRNIKEYFVFTKLRFAGIHK